MNVRYCECGRPVRLAFRWNGHNWIAEFFDCRSGDPIEHCPGCGEFLCVRALRLNPPLEACEP